MKFLITILFFANVSAAIVCKGTSRFGEVQVSIDTESITVEGGQLEDKITFNDFVEVWDGHATGLITAIGFSMKFNNHYGCIRNAEITTNLRGQIGGIAFIDSFKVKTCTGGSTPDDLCLGRRSK